MPAMPHVLIVDDNEGDRYILSRLLAKTGEYSSVAEVIDGQEALEYMDPQGSSKTAPDLIFLDVNMPRVDGFEFLERFELQRSRPGAPDTGVILLVSPHDPRGHRERALQFSSVVGFVTKMPTNSADLLRQIGLGLSADPS